MFELTWMDWMKTGTGNDCISNNSNETIKVWQYCRRATLSEFLRFYYIEL